jgi:F0F1-type ATP synthase delta subunit
MEMVDEALISGFIVSIGDPSVRGTASLKRE